MPVQPRRQSEPAGFLSGNALKLIAAVSMLVDHVGLLLFPQTVFLRILGRLAFPIFAFMIAEGCKYTRSPWRYFRNLALLALLCQIVYYLVDRSLYLCVLVTFSLSLPVIFALRRFRAAPGLRSGLVLAVSVGAVYVLNLCFDIDYGFWGCLLPVFASLLQGTEYDGNRLNVGMLGLGLLCLSAVQGCIQYYSLLALPLLLCYNGKRGKWKMKSFFYLFYPAHLAVLQLIAWLLGR